MWIWFSIVLGICIILLMVCLFFWLSFFHKKITRHEMKIIQLFSSRSDMICALYEILKDEIGRHEEIFREVLELRKREFSLLCMSHNIEGYMKLQGQIHHEINFIFQIANKNPKLLKDKRFLYIREQILIKSSEIKIIIHTYNSLILLFNTHITIKNITGIGLFLPFFHKQNI